MPRAKKLYATERKLEEHHRRKEKYFRNRTHTEEHHQTILKISLKITKRSLEIDYQVSMDSNSMVPARRDKLSLH